VWRSLEKNVPRSKAKQNKKIPWNSKALHILKNKSNSAAKKMKQSEALCLSDPGINECNCERLRNEFDVARSEYKLVSRNSYEHYRENLESSIKTNTKAFFKYVDLKKNRVGLPSVTKFEEKVATTAEAKCEVFAEFIQSTYADEEWVPPDPGPEVISIDPSFGSQFSIAEVELVLKDLDVNKGPGPDKIPPSIL
jgi:hypothetical protein